MGKFPRTCGQVQMQVRNKLLVVVKAVLINLPPLGSRWSPIQTHSSPPLAYQVVTANVLANYFLLSPPAETKQYYHLIGAVFLAT